MVSQIRGMATIRISAMLDEMEREVKGQKKPFTLTFIMLNRAKRTGGKTRTVQGWIRCGQKHNMKNNGIIGIKEPDSNNHPIPVHIWLITHFNGKEVIL